MTPEQHALDPTAARRVRATCATDWHAALVLRLIARPDLPHVSHEPGFAAKVYVRGDIGGPRRVRDA